MIIETYRSENAPEYRRWIAYLVHKGAHLPVVFRGETEDEAMDRAQAEWDRHEKEREVNIARKNEARKRRAESKASKGGALV